MNEPPNFCAFCGHPYHRTDLCTTPIWISATLMKGCKCKGKAGFWSKLGSALGEALFGGRR